MGQLYIWDGLTDFNAPHRKLFDFNKHKWTDDFLALAGQPILSMGIEWQGSRRHGGWGAEYHLAYWGKEPKESAYFGKGDTCPECGITATESGRHMHEIGEEKLYFKQRTDIATLRKELRPFLKGIQVYFVSDFLRDSHSPLPYERWTIDAPPCDYDKLRPYYDKAEKNLKFPNRKMLERFIAYAWGPDGILLISRTEIPPPTATPTTQTETGISPRIEGLIDGVEKQ